MPSHHLTVFLTFRSEGAGDVADKETTDTENWFSHFSGMEELVTGVTWNLLLFCSGTGETRNRFFCGAATGEVSTGETRNREAGTADVLWRRSLSSTDSLTGDM